MHCTGGMVAANHNFGHRHGCSLHVPVPLRSHNLRTSVGVSVIASAPTNSYHELEIEKIRTVSTGYYNCGASTLTGSDFPRYSCHQLPLRISTGHQRDTTLAGLRRSSNLTPWRASTVNYELITFAQHQRDSIRLYEYSFAGPDSLISPYPQLQIESVH
jgi:hypothetical protein